MLRINPQHLGGPQFKTNCHLKYAYLAGVMYKGIVSAELVIKLGKASLMGFLGTGALKLERMESAIRLTIDVQDTTYAPVGDMFEIGAKVQVLRKGLFFPARANKLYDLYRQYNSLKEFAKKLMRGTAEVLTKYFNQFLHASSKLPLTSFLNETAISETL